MKEKENLMSVRKGKLRIASNIHVICKLFLALRPVGNANKFHTAVQTVFQGKWYVAICRLSWCQKKRNSM